MKVRLPDGSIAEFPDGTDPEVIKQALRKQFSRPQEPAQPNADGTYGQPPEGMFFNPRTQQWQSEENIRNNLRQHTEMGGEGARGRGDAALSGAYGGSTFNWGDEGLAAAGIPPQVTRAVQDFDRENHPWAYAGGEVAGAVNTALPTAKLAAGPTLLSTIGRGTAMGAAEGAAFGAGRGDDTGRTAPAMTDSAIGAIAGALSPMAMTAGRKLIDPIVAALSSKPSARKVGGTVRQMAQRSKITPEQAVAKVRQAAEEGQPEYAIMDAFGDAGQRKANAVARQPGEGSAEIRQYLEQRQASQPQRVQAFTDEAYGTRNATGTAVIPRTADVVEEAQGAAVGTAQRRKDVLKQNRDLVADAQYAAAREGAGAVDVRGALGVIDDYVAPLKDVDITDNNLAGRLTQFRNRLAVPGENLTGDVSAMELSNFDRILRVKQDVQQARMAAKGYDRKKLAELEKALDGALEDASEGYRKANDAFAAGSRQIDAVDAGRDMATRGRPEDNISAYGRMTPEEQAAARVGYADRFTEQNLRNAAPTTDRSKPLRSPKVAQERGAMVRDDGLFDRRIGREGEMWRTQNRALGNSSTADNLGDIDDMNAGRRLLSAGSDLLHGRVGTAAGKATDAVSPYLAGENEATRTQIARLLMSKDPEAALQKALREDMDARQRSALTDAIVRRLALTASSAAQGG